MARPVSSKPGRKRSQPLTIMVVPRSGKILSFNIYTAVLTAIAVVALAVALVITGFGIHYKVVLGEVRELQVLRQVTQEQREKIEEMQQKTDTMEQDLTRVKQLEQRIRDLLRGERDVLEKNLGRKAVFDDSLEIAALPPLTLTSRSAIRGLRWSTGDVAMLSSESERLSLSQTLLQRALHETHSAFLSANDELEDKVASFRALPNYFPCRGTITSRFGRRVSPFGKWTEYHEGVDIAAPLGTPVVAAGDGTVRVSGYKAGFGRIVTIDHGNGLTTTYGHLLRSLVSPGEKVRRGTPIAAVGSSGLSTGPHVHFEVRERGRLVDPMRYLK